MTSYYREGNERAHGVRQLFSKIARHYDLINDLQSLGMHRIWKHRLVSALKLPLGSRVLDLACGSGDLTFRILTTNPQIQVIGGDFTFPMLQVARTRSSQKDLIARNWVQLNGLEMPFPNETFDAIVMAYGLRNMTDPKQALHEIARVTKTGGEIMILDFGKPPNRWIRSFYYRYLKTIQPALGWLFFGDAETYRYIYESLMRYPAQEGVCRLLNEASFKEIRYDHLFLGTMSLHTAVK